MSDSKNIAQIIAKIAADKKAEDVVILDVQKIFSLADYFVICSATTPRHSQGIALEIQEEFKKQNIKILHIEGYEEGKWVLLDIGDVVLHIYLAELRNFYELEDLWADAPKVAIS